MIDLKKYYDENASGNDYYLYKFGVPYINTILPNFYIYDLDDAIKQFKNLIMPYNNGTSEDDEKFLYLCFYLYNSGYSIKEYPDFLKRPSNRWDLSYTKIRNSIIQMNGDLGCVKWSERRVFVENLEFIIPKLNCIDNDLNNMLQLISTRNAKFEEMALDEKLKEICNCIEYLLKNNGKFITVDYNNSSGYLNDDLVKKFRNKLECFRHSSENALNERHSYNDSQKNFLIDYGIVILNYIKNNK